MNHFFKSLQARLVFLIILVALPGLTGHIYGAYKERKLVVKSALNQAISAAELTTNVQSHLIDKTKIFLQNLSTFSAVVDQDPAKCNAFLADVLKVNSSYINIGAPTIEGDLLCNAMPMSKNINVADRPYIKKAINTKAFSIGQFQVDRVTNETSINFAYPVIPPEKNNVTGLVVAVISLDWWSEQLSDSQLPEGTVAYITDQEQNIIAAFPSNNSLLGKNIASIENELLQNEPTLNQNTEPQVVYGDVLRVFVKKPLFNDSELIHIIVGIPFGEQLAAINSHLITTSTLLLFIVFLMVIIAIFGIRRTLLDPLNFLIQSTKDLELGKDIGELPRKGSSELIELQQRFSLMARTRLNAEKRLINSQQSLQKSERRLSCHIENTPLGCISWDRELICTQWNKSAETIFGYSAGEAIGKSAMELILKPSLTEKLKGIYQLLLEKNGGAYNTNENQTKSGSTIICDWYSTPIIGLNGAVEGVTSLVQDVTKSKQLEEQLTLAASVFSHAREGIFITDLEGKIIDVNQTFVNITGYQREEVLGKNPNFLKSHKQKPEFYQQMWASINENGFWFGEIWNKRKNNEVYAQLLNISAVYDSNKKVKNYVAIFTDISEYKKQQQQLEQMAHYDVLTNLPNRTLFASRLNHSINLCNLNKSLLAVVFLDLDGFKEINDTHGHSVGDELLVIVATRLNAILRECDTLSRFGGDEFIGVLADIKNIDEFNPIVEEMLAVVSKPYSIRDNVLKVSASIGITFYPTDLTDADQLIRHADQAMYVAKQKGKNCYHVFDIQSEDAIKIKHETLLNITEALSNNEFVLFYQPKVNMKTGEFIGAEALIRWQHPTKGLLPPIEFLPVIENHQLSIDIGKWVIEAALKQIQEWQSNGLVLQVSVNIGALQIQQKDFAEHLQKLLEMYPEIEPRYLQLEVLETSDLGDLLSASETMDKCLALGVSFAIDDFGTGYSSLTYLRRLPANLIKIDQVFIRDMLDDPEDKAIVVGIIALAKSFNRCVIAEGVETIAHGKALLELGCELGQGYGIARPMPAKNIPQWADTWEIKQEWKI